MQMDYASKNIFHCLWKCFSFVLWQSQEVRLGIDDEHANVQCRFSWNQA